MLVACQKFRSRTLGYHIRSCHVITHNTGPIVFTRNENIAHVMPGVTAHAVTSCAHRTAHERRQAGHPNYMWHQDLLMDMPFVQAERYLSKLTASHFSTLNTKFANRNMLKRILIVMLNENKANWDENFRICAEEPVAPLYKW